MPDGIDWMEFLGAIVVGIIGVSFLYIGFEYMSGLSFGVGAIILVILFLYITISHR